MNELSFLNDYDLLSPAEEAEIAELKSDIEEFYDHEVCCENDTGRI